MKFYGHFTTSVKKALKEIDPHYEEYKGVVICGSHSPDKLELDTLLKQIEIAREEGIPTLGICFGHQVMAIEYARNVLGVVDATSEEFSGSGTNVVKDMGKLVVGLKDGDSYWHRYEVNPGLLEIMTADNSLRKHPFYKSVQYHPEYQSSKDKPHYLLIEFLKVCRNGR